MFIKCFLVLGFSYSFVSFSIWFLLLMPIDYVQIGKVRSRNQTENRLKGSTNKSILSKIIRLVTCSYKLCKNL